MHPAVSVEVDLPGSTGSSVKPARRVRIETPELRLVQARNVVCLPRQVICRDGLILPDSFRRVSPEHSHVQLTVDGERQVSLQRDFPAPERIDGECFYLDGEHADHYGHLLLEVLSRSWCFRDVDFTRLRFVTSARPHPRIEALLAPFGVSADRINHFQRPIWCDTLLIATQAFILDQAVAPRLFTAWDRIGAHDGAPDGAERIYVSRTAWSKQRNLINEPEIEDLFRGYGFAIVHPESLSQAEQIATFRAASFIAGPSGSGLYNTIFCKNSGKRLLLASERFVKLNDALINLKTRSHMRYVTGRALTRDRPAMQADWIVDTDEVRRAIEQMLAEQ